MVSFLNPNDHSKGIRLSLVHRVVRFEGQKVPLERSTGLCISPIRISTMSLKVSSFKPSRGELSLANVMSPQDLRLIKWVIGNALLDPVDRPRALYLYGAGGEGKSATINTLLAHLPGAVHPLSKDYVRSNHSMSTDDLTAAMSSRFISYGDVVLTKSKINTSFWKTITGGDTIKVVGGQGRVVCVINKWEIIKHFINSHFHKNAYNPSNKFPIITNKFLSLTITITLIPTCI